MSKKREFRVEQPAELMNFLREVLPDKSRTTIKSYLAHRQVEIGRQITTQFNAPLKAGDRVTVYFEKRHDLFRHPQLKIIYEDAQLIVVDKASGLLSMGTDRERERTAFYILSQYVKQADPQNRIFILHRLDRDTSGLMVFAKSQEVQRQMQSNWDEVVRHRHYVAVIEGALPKEQGRVATYLTENKGYKVYVCANGEGERAITDYRHLQRGTIYSLIELSLQSGKKNQIRAHMEYMSRPVAGDQKYGAKTDPIGRLALHACRLCFVHPTSGEELDFTTPVPSSFLSLFREK